MSPIRHHCYLSAIAPKTHEHFLFECTAIAGGPLQDWLLATGTLRGCHFAASRPKRRKNAKVEIFCSPYDITHTNLPKAPDIPAAMAVIWQLPGKAVAAKPDISGLETLDLDATLISAQRNNELHANRSTHKSNGKSRPCTTAPAN
jgi:hypothetical protein